MTLRSCLLLCAGLAGFSMPAAFGWGADGHKIIGEVAMKNLPRDLPAFLRNAAAADRIGYLAPEADRERGAGTTRDKENDPGHFVDVSDNLTVRGGPWLKALPETREEYDTALRAVGSTEYKAGYLPYAIAGGYQLLVKDFAYWRADAAGEKFAKAAERAWYKKDRQRREEIVLHDLGIWSHFVGDGSMPLHVSVHFNGWGDYPNPERFTREHVHGSWESGYVRANISEAAVARALPAPHICPGAIMTCTENYLLGSQAQVVPFYRLEKTGAFAASSAKGTDFTAKQIARGASELRDLIAQAWRMSASAKIGWPEVTVSDIESGKADPLPVLKN